MTVFEFDSITDFIRFRISEQLYGKAGRKKSNLTKVSRDLGYSSPSLLSMVLKGRRLPSDALCSAMCRKWNLDPAERTYFRLLLELEQRKRQGLEPGDLVDRMHELSRNRGRFTLQEAELNRIREWYFIVVQQLVELPEFREDPVWISRKLRDRVSPAEAHRALTELESIGIIVRNPRTGKLEPASRNIESSHDIPSSAIREHQRGMITQAIEAMEDRPLEERFFNTLTFNFDSKRLGEARSTLREFMRKFNDEFSQGTPNSVFQMNFQLFEHTVSVGRPLNGRRNRRELN